MKLVQTCRWTALAIALALPGSALAAGNEPEWLHGHGHGGGGVAAIGKSGDPAKVSRTVTLTVSDGAPFTPSTITVKEARRYVSL